MHTIRLTNLVSVAVAKRIVLHPRCIMASKAQNYQHRFHRLMPTYGQSVNTPNIIPTRLAPGKVVKTLLALILAVCSTIVVNYSNDLTTFLSLSNLFITIESGIIFVTKYAHDIFIASGLQTGRK